MDRISDWDEYFMRMAYLVADKSKDPRTRIGSVIVRDKIVISSGFNGFPIGVLDLPERYSNRELKLKYVSHAESNSILLAARNGISTLGSLCYTQGLPCEHCCKSLIQGGIRQIVIHKQWPQHNWENSSEITRNMLKESGVEIKFLDKELGIKGFLDGKEVSV